MESVGKAIGAVAAAPLVVAGATGAITSAGATAIGATKAVAGAVVSTAADSGVVAFKAGSAVSKVAGEQMLATAAKIDSIAISTGEKIAGEIGKDVVTKITQQGTYSAGSLRNVGGNHYVLATDKDFESWC